MGTKPATPELSPESNLGYWVDLSSIQLSDDSGDNPPYQAWVHALPLGNFKHPKYGVIRVSQDRIQRFAESVKNRVRGTDLDIDYDHKKDPSQGSKAAGWVKDADVRGDGLHLLVEFTKAAADGIRNREWRYFSPELLSVWESPTGQKFRDVLAGGGLTNRPFLKNLLPINLSEVIEEGENMDELLKQLRETLQLGEDADQEEILTTLATKLAEPPAPPAPDPDTKPTEGKEKGKLAQLAEEHPEVAQLLQLSETLSGRVTTLEETTRKGEAAVKLTEWNSPEYSGYAFPAKLHEPLQILLSEAPDETQTKLHEVLGAIAKDGLVELGERGGRGGGTEEDPLKKFNEAVSAKMKDEKLSYADAVEAITFAEPELYDRARIYMTEEV